MSYSKLRTFDDSQQMWRIAQQNVERKVTFSRERSKVIVYPPPLHAKGPTVGGTALGSWTCSWPVIAGSNAVIPLTVILVLVDFLKGSITELLRVRLNANVHRKFIPLSFPNLS